MKGILILISFLLVVSSDSNAQWTQMNSNTNIRLHSIYFLDSAIGYCTGGGDMWGSGVSDGLVLKTTDGGANWASVYSDTLIALTKVIAKGSEVFAYGNKYGTPVQITSGNGGATWSLDTIPKIIYEVKIYQNDLYISDRYSLKRVSSGISQTLKGSVSIFDVGPGGIVAVVNELNIQKSPDFGMTWVTVLPNIDVTGCVTSNSLTYATIGIWGDTIVLKGTYPGANYYSTDNGANWICNLGGSEKQSAIVGTNIIYGQQQLPPGGNYSAIKTNDFGVNYISQDTFPHLLRDYYFHDPANGFACGDNGSIYRIKNGGAAVVSNTQQVTEQLKQQIKVYPNPGKGHIKIELTGVLKVQSICLLDMNGQQVREYRPSERTLNLEGLAQGQYLLRVETDKGVVSEKVLVN